MYPGGEWVKSGASGETRRMLALGVGLLGGTLGGLYLADRLLCRRAVVTNVSMYPLLRPGDRVLFDRLDYCLQSRRRGEIVLVRRLDRPKPALIKIVAGLPGERVRASEVGFSIDGRPLDLWAPYVGSTRSEWHLADDEYFLLSYNLATGADSRQFGPVPRSSLIGSARRIYWPLGRRQPLCIRIADSDTRSRSL